MELWHKCVIARGLLVAETTKKYQKSMSSALSCKKQNLPFVFTTMLLFRTLTLSLVAIQPYWGIGTQVWWARTMFINQRMKKCGNVLVLTGAVLLLLEFETIYCSSWSAVSQKTRFLTEFPTFTIPQLRTHHIFISCDQITCSIVPERVFDSMFDFKSRIVQVCAQIDFLTAPSFTF